MECMTHIEKTVKEAVEKGGYERTGRNYTSHLGRWHLCELWVDPLFWQSLGKARGWAENGLQRCSLIKEHYSNQNDVLGRTGTVIGYTADKLGPRVRWDGNKSAYPYYHEDIRLIPKSDNWKYQWHRFIDHLTDGKDANSFFETL
jgi:hypothetical protein